ncbi:MAG: ABC transporter ATP-binding protein, partial [Brachybacterium sp.]|nr:ABC transporter ATP-binding protein [Brachybacterium sp.]
MLDSRSTAVTAPAPPRASAPGVMASIVRRHRRMLAVMLPVATLSEGVELLTPIVLGLVIDHGVMAGDLRLTVLGARGLILLRLVGVVMWAWIFVQTQKAVMYERHRLRVGLTGAVL